MSIKINIALTAALLSGSASAVFAASVDGSTFYCRHGHAIERAAPPNVFGGHEIEAPSWSFACMTDHGPSPCGEHMWVYGSIGTGASLRR